MPVKRAAAIAVLNILDYRKGGSVVIENTVLRMQCESETSPRPLFESNGVGKKYIIKIKI